MARVKKEYPEIQLDDTYRVVSDAYNWQLEKLEDVMDRETKQPTGEKRYKNVGYFGGNFAQALKRYVRESVNDSTIETIHDILDKLNELDKKIDKVVKKENIKLVVKDND